MDLKIRAEKKTKFVQYFPDMMKQVENTIKNKLKPQILPNEITQLELPDFDYEIVNKQDLNKQVHSCE